MIKPEELRIGNIIFSCQHGKEIVITAKELFEIATFKPYEKVFEPIPLTEELLVKAGFNFKQNEMYCNGKQWFLQVTRDYEENEINRDGTWFDGIGDYSWIEDSDKPKTMAVNVLCRGNYVCNSVKYLHQLQNLYFVLTGTELTIKL